MAIYSFCGTPIQIEITDENAAVFNTIAKAFGDDPFNRTIEYVGKPEDLDVFNKVAALINGMIDLNDGDLPYPDEQLYPLQLVEMRVYALRQNL